MSFCEQKRHVLEWMAGFLSVYMHGFVVILPHIHLQSGEKFIVVPMGNNTINNNVRVDL